MRTLVLVFAMASVWGSASSGMPISPLATPANTIQLHGCHPKYSHDTSGWHRHDKQCRSLRGLVGRKSKSQSKPDRSCRRAADAGEALGAALAAFAGVTEEAG